MARDEFLKGFKYSKPLAGKRTTGKIPTHTPGLPDKRVLGKIPGHTPKPVRGIDIESKLSDYKPYKKASK